MIDPATSGSIIETERLWLPPLAETDAEDFETLFRDDWDAVKYTGQIPYPVTKAAMQVWIRKCTGPGGYAFLMRRKTDNRSIGAIGFGGRGTIAELGYILGRVFWGQGFASEAVIAMIDVARTVGLGGLQAYCFLENPASARVLEKAGFANIGTIIREYPKRGGMRRVMHFRTTL